jgi:hypothetical protein
MCRDLTTLQIAITVICFEVLSTAEAGSSASGSGAATEEQPLCAATELEVHP